MDIQTTLLSADWRLENLYKIKDKQKSERTFKLNTIQKRIHSEIRRLKKENKPIRLIILKPRQIGCTTYFCLLELDQVYFNTNQFAAIIAHRRESANVIFSEIIRFAYEKLPSEPINIRFKAQNESARQLTWRNIGSQILVAVDAHGITPNILHFTEVARMKNPKEVIDESLQSVPLFDSLIVKESTSNGSNNYFYNDWYETLNNPDSVWTPMFLKWWEHDEYVMTVPDGFKQTEEEKELMLRIPALKIENIVWRRWKIEEMHGNKVDQETGLSGVLLFRQNYPVSPEEAFIVRGGSLFDSTALHNMLMTRPDPISEQQYGKGTLRVYKSLAKNREYVISCDPSFGEGNSYSAVTILEKESRYPVATLHGKYLPNELSKYLHKLALFYNGALVVVERNTGHVILNELINHLMYYNVYHHMEYDQKRNKMLRPGFPTTTTTRNLILSKLEDTISSKEVMMPDEFYIRECLNFGLVDGKNKAQSGNDDRVMSWAIGNYICLQSNVVIHSNAEKPLGV